MIRLHQIMMPLDHTFEALQQKCYKLLRVSNKDVISFSIVRQSIDARKKPEIYYSYTLDIACVEEEKVLKKCKSNLAEYIQPVIYAFPDVKRDPGIEDIIIIGMGPAGLFCAYMLAKQGFRPVILERGEDVDSRLEKVKRFWETGVLDTKSNVQFGEGGAGTFSDGKLNTLIKDPFGRSKEVLSILVENGAPKEIMYDAKPHIGTDILATVVKNMRKRILEWGGKVFFNSQVSGFSVQNGAVTGVELIDGSHMKAAAVVLAVGHSARDTFSCLYNLGVTMSSKPFAVGFRVQHPQAMINMSQYGVEKHPILGAAPYKVVAKTSVGRGVYSFCMCPGGYVVNASSEEGRTVVNGMSYSGRNSSCANSAIIVSVSPDDYKSDHPLAGVWFQQTLEEKAFLLGEGAIPVEKYGDFKETITGEAVTNRLLSFEPCIKGAYKESDLSEILTPEMNHAFIEGMEHFNNIIPLFADGNVWMCGVESRTSSPLRIERDASLQSNLLGLYPCGEGAGYAGGITSAAMDGLKVAEELAKKYSQKV